MFFVDALITYSLIEVILKKQFIYINWLGAIVKLLMSYAINYLDA
jgi:hypothetical protein